MRTKLRRKKRMQMVLRRATLEVYFFENNVKLLFIFSFMETFDVISERKEIFEYRVSFI